MAWYISLTMRWTDLSGALSPFLDLCTNAEIPSNHIRIHQRSWHSTLYAFAKIHRIFEPHDSMHDCALAVLEQFRSCGLTQSLSDLPEFRLSPHCLQHFTSISTIQFDPECDKLESLRSIVAKSVAGISLPFDKDDVAYPFNGGRKNSGSALWGAIARHPASTEHLLQQRISISGFEKHCFTARNAILTVSDESLTNHLAAGDFDAITLR